jgi:hypothetical protein
MWRRRRRRRGEEEEEEEEEGSSLFFQNKIPVSNEKHYTCSSKTNNQAFWLLQGMECLWQCICTQKQNILLDKLIFNITVFRNVIIFNLARRHQSVGRTCCLHLETSFYPKEEGSRVLF